LPIALLLSPVSVSLLTENIGQELLIVSQIPFEDEKVTSGTLEMHRVMVARESRGPGDTENAMRRLEAKYGLDFWTQWGLRYRPPVEIKDRSLIERIRQAYLDMMARSVRRDLEALKAEQAKGADDAALTDLIVEAETVLERLQAKRSLISAR
jgi:hypothetical protein